MFAMEFTRTTMNKLLSICLIALFFTLSSAHAVTPSPAMLEQLKKLPKSEQTRLMKQYGISPNQLKGLEDSDANDKASSLLPAPRQNEEDKQNKDLLEKEEKLPYEQEELKPFGYDLFAGEPISFAPINDIPVAANYIVGPTDEVIINLYGRESAQHKLKIDRNGLLDIPDLGPFDVNGLTFEELKVKVTDIVDSKYTGVRVSVGLGELRSIRVFIAGDAYKPGSYTLNSLSTITQAIFAAGGINEIGSLRNIQLKRQGKLVSRFDLYDLLINGDASGDKRLRSGDVVFIPPVGDTVSIKGEVRRPAIYELKNNETISQLVKLAAGLNSDAYPAATVLQRIDEQRLPSFINVDLTTSAANAKKLKNGDVLIVKGTTQRIHRQIALMGAVTRPGLYQWHKDIRVNDIIKSSWSDLKNTADLNYALVVRERNMQGDIEVLQFNLGQAIDVPNSADNILLAPRDMLLVVSTKVDASERIELDKLIAHKIEDFSEKNFQGFTSAGTAALFAQGFAELTQEQELSETYNKIEEPEIQLKKELQQQELELAASAVAELLSSIFDDKKMLQASSVLTREELLFPLLQKLQQQANSSNPVALSTIGGEVRFPGVYPLAKHGNVRRLIQAAGGLKESAYIKSAELSRNIVDENYEVKAQHLSVDLLALSPQSPMLLKSRDHLTILTVPDWQKTITVELLGEVKFPGKYSITSGDTMMSVVERAGGFKDNAFIEGAVFTRESVRQAEHDQVSAMSDQLRREIATRGLSQEGNFVSFTDASKMLNELENIETLGRMVINLAALEERFSANQFADGLRLEDGDKLYIPQKKQSVTVVGEVQHASSHFYQGELKLDEYIVLAGGLKQRADDERIYIIKANGAVVLPQKGFWFDSSTEIKPGDTIVVPLHTEYKDTLSLWTQVTGIIYNSAVAFSAIKGI